MTFKRRFYNVARAEATRAAHRFRAATSGLFEVSSDSINPDRSDPEYARIRAEVEAEFANVPPGGAGSIALDSPEIRRFYANLELPLGASADEVKAAYRRLMRRYHPDKHHADPERARVAHQLAHELRQAYEGLLKHLLRRR